MFTKYTNIKLPENYGGSRFKKSTIDTEMKTHRPQDMSSSASTVKTSVSPSFQSSLANIKAEVPSAYIGELQENTKEFDQTEELDNTEYDDFIDTPPLKIEENANCESDTSTSIKELAHVLENIKSDDFLLLALILLFAKDGGEESMDAIVILALLLLYR